MRQAGINKHTQLSSYSFCMVLTPFFMILCSLLN